MRNFNKLLAYGTATALSLGSVACGVSSSPRSTITQTASTAPSPVTAPQFECTPVRDYGPTTQDKICANGLRTYVLKAKQTANVGSDEAYNYLDTYYEEYCDRQTLVDVAQTFYYSNGPAVGLTMTRIENDPLCRDGKLTATDFNK